MDEDSGFLALRWNNHERTFSSILDSLRTQESYCDVSIACGGRFYPVHKFVLSTCSEYFREAFLSSPCSHPVIIIKGITSAELEAILDFMYRGEVHVTREDLPSLLQAAETLQVKGLAIPDSSPHPGTPAARPSTPRAKGGGNNSANKRKRAQESLKRDEPPPRLSILPQLGLDPSTAGLAAPPELKRIKISSEGASTSAADPSAPSNGLGTLSNGLPAHSLGGKMTQHFQAPNSLSAIADLGRLSEEGGDALRLSPSGSNRRESNGPLDTEEETSEVLQVDLSEDGSQFIIGPSSQVKSEAEGNTSPSVSEEDASSELSKKPFVCPMCGHSFTRRDNLSNHLKTHTGDRPHMCQYCHKCFSRKDYLKQHERIHTGEKPFECPECSRAFTRKEGLTDHMRCHSDFKEFACDLCPRTFKQKCGLRFHKRSQH